MGSTYDFAKSANDERMSFLKKRGYGADSSGATADAGGMGAMDYAGIGMQVAGAMENDREAERDRQDQIKQRNALFLQQQRQRMDAMKQQETENQMAKRGQNQRGLEYMTGLVDSNRAAGRQNVPSFRDTMLSVGGY